MKRVKMMLLSLALFAVVGAALAFKARFKNDYCVTATSGSTCNVSGLVCTLPSLQFKPGTTGSAFCTTDYDGNSCANGAGIACSTVDPIQLITD